ncbi:MAG: DUF397 domain-containing protein [Actinomycetota bacterium]
MMQWLDGERPGGWAKSRFSNGQCSCVEFRQQGPTMWIRDSKDLRHPDVDPAAVPMIAVPVEVFAAWAEAVRDRPLPLIVGPLLTSADADGGATVTHESSQVALTYTADEWSAFVAGVEVDGFVGV